MRCAGAWILKNATAKFGGLNLTAAELRAMDRIVIAASGTSWHAALVGEYLIEELAHLPVEVEFAHEFCYRNAPLEKDTVLLVHFAIRRNGRYAGGVARGEAARPQGAGDRERGGQHHRARSRTAAFTCTRGRKSAWLPRRRSSRR